MADRVDRTNRTTPPPPARDVPPPAEGEGDSEDISVDLARALAATGSAEAGKAFNTGVIGAIERISKLSAADRREAERHFVQVLMAVANMAMNPPDRKPG